MNYKRLKYTLVSLLVIYFCAGVTTEVLNNGRDVYPIFSWRLFAKVQSEVSAYRVEIHTLGGVAYDPPLTFSETKFLFESISQSPTDYEHPIQNLGASIRGNDTEGIERYRATIEGIFPEGPFIYEVVSVSYDSLEYWHTRNYKKQGTLQRYAGTH